MGKWPLPTCVVSQGALALLVSFSFVVGSIWTRQPRQLSHIAPESNKNLQWPFLKVIGRSEKSAHAPGALLRLLSRMPSMGRPWGWSQPSSCQTPFSRLPTSAEPSYPPETWRCRPVVHEFGWEKKIHCYFQKPQPKWNLDCLSIIAADYKPQEH